MRTGDESSVDLNTCLIAGPSLRECCPSIGSSSSSTSHQPSLPVTRLSPAQSTLPAGFGHGSHHMLTPVRLSLPLHRASRREYAASELPGHSTQRSAWGLFCVRSSAYPRGHSVRRMVRGPLSSEISTSHLEPSTLGITCAPSDIDGAHDGSVTILIRIANAYACMRACMLAVRVPGQSAPSGHFRHGPNKGFTM